MLDFFVIGIDHDYSWCDHRSRDVSERGPTANAKEQDKHDRCAKPDLFTDGGLGSNLCCRDHDAVLVASPTILNGAVGADTGRKTLGRISSLGPRAHMRPSLITSRVSTAARTLGWWAIMTTIPPRSRTPKLARVKAASPSASRF